MLKLPTMADVQAQRSGPLPKSSRLKERIAVKKLDVVDDNAFRAAVRRRDRQRCRVCGRKTVSTMELKPERAEVHHLHGRAGIMRHLERCAICVCRRCHEDLTRHRVAVTGPVWELTAKQGLRVVLDATQPLTFTRLK